MPSRKSFDIGPSGSRSESSKVRTGSRPVRRDKTSARRNARAVADGKGKTLRARRREARNRTGIITLVLLLIVGGAVVYGAWRPEVRIVSVSASGVSDAESLIVPAKAKLSGTYFGIIPRNSFFFYPEDEVRASILSARPDVSAVSLSRVGFTALSIRALKRSTAFIWCGTVPSVNETCYNADAEGFVFAPVATTSATSTTLRIYATADAASSTDSYPLRAQIEGVGSIPRILEFVKAVNALNIPVVSISIRNDEADLYTGSGTRITYVIGREEAAASSFQAALPSLNVNDGSLEYVDLRFPGKVYDKPKGK